MIWVTGARAGEPALPPTGGAPEAVRMAAVDRPLGSRVAAVESAAGADPLFDEPAERRLLIFMATAMAGVLVVAFMMYRTQRRLRREVRLRQQSEEDVRRSHNLLERAGRLAKVGGWEYDFANDRQTWTDEAARIRDIPPDTALTQAELLAAYAPAERAFFRAAVEAAVRDGVAWEHESLLTTPSGREVWVQGRGEPVVRDGKTVMLTGVLQDITERKKAEIELVRTNGLLKAIIDTSPLRVFWKDTESRYLGCNPLFARDAGFDTVDEVIGKDDFAMPWRDRAEAYVADDRAVMTTRQPRLFFDEERPAADGRTVWLRMSKVPLLDGRGELLGVLGYYEDVSAQKQAGMALLRRTSEIEMHNRILRQINTGMPLQETLEYMVRQIEVLHPWMRCSIMLVDPSGRRLEFGAAPSLSVAHRASVDGLPIEEGGGSCGTAAFRGERVIVEDALVHPFFAAYRDQVKAVGLRGSWSQPIMDYEGRVLGVFAIYLREPAVPDSDSTVLLETYANLAGLVIERHRSEAQIRNLAYYDALTRLPNRRMLADRVAVAMALSRRNGRYAALMFLDLDNFKPLNDHHGHAVGDLLLVQVAERIGGCVRQSDTVARFGGDEFVVMLGDLGDNVTEAKTQAGLVAEKIRSLIAEPFHLESPAGDGAGSMIEHRCSASIGVVLFIGHQASFDEILKWADAAMYQAKNEGRNAIRFHG